MSKEPIKTAFPTIEANWHNENVRSEGKAMSKPEVKRYKYGYKDDGGQRYLSLIEDGEGSVFRYTDHEVSRAADKAKILELENALKEVVDCFDAAEFEGMSLFMQEDATDRLEDLWNRRVLYAYYAAETALTQQE
jgi:hypothetical protein